MRKLRFMSVGMFAAALAGAACEPRGEEVPYEALPSVFHIDSARLRIETAAGSHLLRVEVADRDDLRARGLMERISMDDDAGMVFLYDDMQPGSAGFWMYRTRIPLDIAFFDGAGRIVSIRQMDPCASPDPGRCPSYAPDATYFGALEVNRGWLTRNGVAVGDRIVVERD
jgi:uncharacterized membrane protein (UPF0127 family)